MCPCRQTDTPYDYETSVEKLEAEHHREAHKQYMELTGGSYCACVVGSNGYQGGWYQVKYDVETCIRQGWIKERLNNATIENGKCERLQYYRRTKTSRGSQKFFRYMNELIRAVAVQPPEDKEGEAA